jgi:hypothetical protein
MNVNNLFFIKRPWVNPTGVFVSGWTSMILTRFHSRKRL